jgi:CubicO group peptidase (beta-lactamase class C family)
MNIVKMIPSAMLVYEALALSQRLFSGGASTSPDSVRPGHRSDLYGAIDTFVAEQVHRLKIPGAALAIVEGDRIVHQRGFGKAHPGGEPPSPQTPFFIGSLSKSFTAMAVMQLVEAGKVELDAPVQRWLPWFRVADPQASSQMTVRHLLNQTSGLPLLPSEAALADFDSSPDAIERQVRALSTVKLTRVVGTKFEYCNTNYNILGLIVEAASGQPYAAYIQQHIYEPLEMGHSHTAKAAAQRDGLAVGHQYWFGIPVPAPNLSIPLGSLPSGQLISSAEDMAHYLIANLNEGRYCGKQVLSEAGVRELHHGAVEWREMGSLIGHYGMGWISQECGRTTIVSHSGTVPDFGAFMALAPEQKKGIVLLFNANHAMMKMTLDEVGMSAALMLAGERPARTILGELHWGMPAMLLIPFLQIASILTTLRLIRGWRENPEQRPGGSRLWGRHILLPLIPNLLPALTLVPLLGKMRGWIRLFMPDYTWIAMICSSLAGVWTFLRPGLILQSLRKPRLRKSRMEVPNQ